MTNADFEGRVFGRLTALRFLHNNRNGSRWVFVCACGNEKVLQKQCVTSGDTRSCGCLRRERLQSGLNGTQHGDTSNGRIARTYSIWRGILKRCNPASKADYIKRYAGRGITVVDEWRDYVTFKTWALANGYAENLSIDRIDNNLGYSPENCRWADRKTQCRNRRTSRNLTIGDRTQTLAAWCEETGMARGLITARLARGWSPARAVSAPAQAFTKSNAAVLGEDGKLAGGTERR